MKFIHTADLHLASKMESRLTPEQAKIRRDELFETFRRMAEFAEAENVRAILISGDLFDEQKPPASAVLRFLEIARRHPSVDFLCLAGNHDENLALTHPPENVKTFGSVWTKYEYGAVDVYGICPERGEEARAYATFQAEKERINLVLLHGQVYESDTEPGENRVILPKLRNKNIDYLALGHLHSYSEKPLDHRGVWCYSGCPEGRGYDECGVKGFVLLTVESGEIKRQFCPFSKRTLHDVQCNLTGLTGYYEIIEAILSDLSQYDRKDLVHLTLTGFLPPETHLPLRQIEETVREYFFAATVKNRVRAQIDPDCYQDLVSLKGEFVRAVRERSDLKEEEKDEILRCGLRALAGEEPF